MRTRQNSELTSGITAATTHAPSGMDESTTLLPSVTETSLPAFQPTENLRTPPTPKRSGKRVIRTRPNTDHLVMRRLLRIARTWGKHEAPTAPAHVGMSIPELIGRLGLAMLASQLPTSEIERQLSEIARVYERPDLRMVVLPTSILVDDPLKEHTSAFPFASGSYRLDQAGATEQLVTRVVRDHPEPEQAIRELSRIEQQPPRFSRRVMVLGHAILTLGFGMVINPTATALPGYLIMGALVGLAVTFTRGRASVQVMLPVLTSFLLTLLTLLTFARLVPDDPLRLVAPALLAFLPGHMLTVAAVELASSQVVAGASRLVYGFAQLGLLAFGVYAAWQLVDMPATRGAPAMLGLWAPWVGVALTSIGFTLYMVAPKGALRWILFVLLVVYAAQFAGSFIVGPALSGFAGSLVLEPLGRAVQRFLGAPATVVLRTAGYFLLVPGALGFIGMSGFAAETGSLALLVQVFVSLLAIGLGTLVGASLNHDVHAAVRTWNSPPS